MVYFTSYCPLYRAFYDKAIEAYFYGYDDIVIALYIGLSTTGFCVSCIYLSYILSHFLSSVNIFLKKVGRSLFPKSLKSLYLSHFFSFPILMVRPTDFLVPVIFTSVY